MLEQLDPTEYANFYNSLKFTLKWEGGYVNDPDDPGGETKWGISKRFHPDVDIKNLDPAGAADIYYHEYWTRAQCQLLPFPMCAVQFDSAVNCGVSRALDWQRKSGGDITNYVILRRDYYYSLKKPKYITGWLNRLSDLQKYCEVLTQQ